MVKKTREDLDLKAGTSLATAGTSGLLPALGADTSKYLGADLEWHIIAAGGDMAKATYDPDTDGKIAEAQLTLSYPTHSNASDHAQNNDTDLNSTFKATLATTASVAAHTTTSNAHGAGTVQTAATTLAGYGITDACSTVAATVLITTHANSTATHGVAGTIAARTDITDTTLVMADNTTNDVTSTKHGFVPKSTADTSLFLRNGTTPLWAAPPAGTGGAGILSTVYTSGTQSFSSTGLANVTGMNFACASTTIYHYKFLAMFKSGTATVGLKWSVTYPASTIAAGRVSMMVTASGTTAYFHGLISTSGTAVTGTSVVAAGTIGIAIVEGIVRATAAGSIQLQAAAEAAGTVWVMDNSVGLLYTIF